jgi:hypothetical protein
MPDPSPSPGASRPVTGHGPEVNGTVEIRRVGRFRFPVFAVMQGDRVVAEMGRTGWFRIFIGRGCRIVTEDGRRWRLVALGSARMLCPVVLDEERRKYVVASQGEAWYGLNGRDYAYVLHAASARRWSRPDRWLVREHEEVVATISSWSRRVETSRPVPLAAVLAAFVVIDYGIPGGESLGVPRFGW